MKKTIIIAVAVVAVAVAAYFLLSGGSKKQTIEFEKARVETTTIQNSITATGTGHRRTGQNQPDQRAAHGAGQPVERTELAEL